MKDIVEYTDYRKFIQDYYDERKRSSAFTWREFAHDAGFTSPVYLKYVCEGKKNLSIGVAGSVANAMGARSRTPWGLQVSRALTLC